ncbi:hypothetical protein CRE_17291 [Caenorhabditis remanei]|uniref:Reverse transcriptase domain-containing protein n=1 Tax=Caenorhabditis remanei TaxID=31234 RepID=E3MRX9_CAERE|nr:hypothetical protein CRE_17291 [Caenorhabditis remanei]
MLSDFIISHTPLSTPPKPHRTSFSIRQLKRARQRYSKLLKLPNPPADQIFRLRTLIASTSKRIKSNMVSEERKILSAPNSRSARLLIKKRTRTSLKIPPLYVNNELISSNAAKSSIFSSVFFSNYNCSPSSSLIPVSNNSSNNISPSELFLPWIIENTLRKVPPRCGFTTHHANFYIIRNCATTLAIPLSIIYSDSFLKSHVPASWKHAIIIPIPKKGSLTSPENYRPISLTDPFSRVCERILCNYIKINLFRNISRFQHGFLSKRSCSSSLVHSISEYRLLLSSHKSLDVVYFDFRKAFDQVDHQFLISKLDSFGIPNIISWLTDFLSDRTFSVKIDDFVGTPSASIPSGVPQGSVSGPLLFLVFINDLLLKLADISSLCIAAFADDIKLYSHDSLALQMGIDLVESWASDNSLPLAHSKTALLRLGPRNSSHPYTIGGSLIDSVDSVRDLGLLIEPNLKFTRHINRAVALALLRSKQLLKSFKSNSPQFYIFLFKTYVLPLVENCSVVYSPPPSSKLAHKLETPLRFFSRKILQRCNTPYCSYSDRLSQLDLFSMRHRRLKAQLLLLYNLIIGASYFPSLETHVRLSSSSRRPMSLICINPNCSNFFSTVVPIWNALTINVPHFLCPSEFNSLLVNNIARF